MSAKSTSSSFAFSLFISIIIVQLTSCDPGVSYAKIIQNDSDYDISIVVHGGEPYYYSADSFYIEKHSEETIMAHGGLGQTLEFEDCSIYADSITSEVMNSDSLKTTYDLNNLSLWNFSILNKTYGSGGTCECRIVLRNEQIE